jgi:S-formylglutathione hydrolase
MWSYLADELPALIEANYPADMQRQSIMGHSMGGHGALTMALGMAERFRAVSAFSPIVAPSQVPWGQKAFTTYFGDDRQLWRHHDAVALVEDGARVTDILIDQGDADPFLEEQLRPELFAAACERAGQPLTLRVQPGYDHSYYFISTFMADHLHWHAERLRAAS